MSIACTGWLWLGRTWSRAALTAVLAVLALPARAEDPPPRTPVVESLGVGWPSGQPLPVGLGLPEVTSQQLSGLSLDQAVQISTQRNPVVRQAYEQLVATQNTLGAAYASWWPLINQSLNGGMDGERAYYNYNGALTGVGAPASGPTANTRAFSSSYFQSVGRWSSPGISSILHERPPSGRTSIWSVRLLIPM